MNKVFDKSWDFSGVDTKYYTHGIHPYPAMMIPQIAKRLIEENKTAETKIGFDPFCGSGSVLLEFKLAEIRSIGMDINPLAVLISKVKTTVIKPELLKTSFDSSIRPSLTALKSFDNIKEPTFKNIDFWFKKPIILRLAVIKKAINKIRQEELRDFFLVCFSETIRACSNTRGSEFKLYRLPEQKLKEHNPDPFIVFQKIAERNIAGMKALERYVKNASIKETEPTILNQDLTKRTKLPDKYADLLVTSPPYGDSRTTVAYGQFSRLSLQWLDFDDELAGKMDQSMMGGKPTKDLKQSLPSKKLNETISNISRKDEKRARDVLSFFTDFFKAANEIERIMKSESKLCFVVGNRTVKETKIPTDEIIVDFFKDLSFEHEKTIVRNIPSKRMPKKNSPTNKPGVLSSTMNEENIIILQR